MKEYDKRNSHISSKLHMIYVSSNNVRHLLLRPSLHFTQLHFTTPSFGLTQFKFTTATNSPHITTLHRISLHCTFR